VTPLRARSGEADVALIGAVIPEPPEQRRRRGVYDLPTIERSCH
jgi:hypothetical protein